MEINDSNAFKIFRDEMAKHGIYYDGEIIFDTPEVQRFRCSCSKTGDRSGAYQAFTGNRPGGWFKCWRCHPETVIWSCKKKNEMTQQEWQSQIVHIEQRKQDEYKKIKQKHAAARLQAQLMFQNALPCNNHRYLDHKKVKAYGLRVRSNWILLIPAHDESGKLVNLERIHEVGLTKEFLKRPLQGGQRIGAFYMIGSETDTKETIYICEGYSTGATIYESTECPAVASFSCTNLPHVALVVRRLHPKANIVIIADLDESGGGEKYGKKAADLVGGKCILPNFSAIQNELKPEVKRSDFNDLFVLLTESGLNRATALATVRQQISTKL